MIRDSDRPLNEAQIKSYMLMLLKGVEFCHSNNIMHRVCSLHRGYNINPLPTLNVVLLILYYIKKNILFYSNILPRFIVIGPPWKKNTPQTNSSYLSPTENK